MSIKRNICAFHTMTKASLPQNKNGYWSIIVWTVSSKWGRSCSNLPISLNSMGNNVGHQHIAIFFESMLLALQFSATLLREKKNIKIKKITITKLSHLTKWRNINFRISKFTLGNFFKRFLKAINRQLRSALTETKKSK